MSRPSLRILGLALLVACAPALPPRGVLERDIGPYHFRRYQEVHDVEVPVSGNPAVGHTATYVRGGENIRLAPVFVTRYAKPEGLAEALRTQLKAMDGYDVRLIALQGAHMYSVKGELGDVWLLWLSHAQLVKLGVPGGEPEVPEVLVRAYLDAYPSTLTADGHSE